jgi:TolA-binding protein
VSRRRARLAASLALGLTGVGPAALTGAAATAFAVPALAQSRPAQGDALSAELLRRLSEYQAEIQRLTAEVEQLSFRLRQSEAAAAARLTDLEMRMTELEGGDPLAAVPGAAPAPAPVQAPAKPAQPTPPPRQTTTAAPPAAGSNAPGPAPGPQPLGTLRQQGSPADERAALDAAASDLATQGVEMGQLSLGAFIERHPGSPLVGEAYHLLGVAFFRDGRYTEAARQFLIGFRDHPSTPMAPNNLVGLGETLVALGKFDEACAALREVPTRYPAAPAALLARADAARSRAGGCR